MSYTVTAHNRAFVIRMQVNRLDSHNSAALKLELRRLVDQRPAVVIVDFSMVSFVDPNGLAALLAGEQVAARNGCRIRVAGLSPDVHSVFAVAQIDRIIDIFPTEREALAG
jgi:stage II sporulation protein AA (anti-sigma F factor antagonist)